MHNNINMSVSGPVQPTSTYKTVVLKGNHSFASQVTEPNTKYVIKHNFDLGGESVTIPENCVLEFDGGSLSGGTIVGQNTAIEAAPVTIFSNSLAIEGTWKAEDYLSEWFGGDAQKCLDIFNNVSFIKNTILDTPITIRNFASVNFKSNISVTVSDNFDGDYLFIVDIDPIYHIYGDVTDGNGYYYKEPKIVFHGCGGNTIDLANKTCFMRQYSNDAIQMDGLNVIRAAKNENECAIVWSHFRLYATDCYFAADRQNEDNHPDYGIKLDSSDNKFVRIQIIINTIGIYGCTGYSLFSEIHVWGAPKIAFYVTGLCSFHDAYSDWGLTSFYVTTDTVYIDGFQFTGPSKNDEHYTGYNYCLIKTPTKNTQLRGVINPTKEVGYSSYNFTFLGYGEEDDYYNSNTIPYCALNLKTSGPFMNITPADVFKKETDTIGDIYSLSIYSGRILKFAPYTTSIKYSESFIFFLSTDAKTVKCEIKDNKCYADGNIDNVVIYVYDNFYYIYNKNPRNLYVVFNKNYYTNGAKMLSKIDGTVYENDAALVAALDDPNIQSIQDLDSLDIVCAVTSESITYPEDYILNAENDLSRCLLTRYDTEIINTKGIAYYSFLNKFENHIVNILLSCINNEISVCFTSYSQIAIYKSGTNTDLIKKVGKIIIDGIINLGGNWNPGAFSHPELELTSNGLICGNNTLTISGIKCDVFKLAGYVLLSGVPAAGTFWIYNGTPVWSTGTSWVDASGQTVDVTYPTTLQLPSAIFSPTDNTFTDSVEVTLSCANPNASIYYTTNGTTPTSASTLYNGAITLIATTTIKAIAILADYTDSVVVSKKYTKR